MFSARTLMLVLVTSHFSAGNDDPCLEGNHEVRYDEFHRSAAFIVNQYECDDNLLIKWYRFVSHAGSDMPLEAPTVVGSCGATYAIWLNDVIQTTTQIQTLDVCMTNGMVPCAKTWPIRVKQCTQAGSSEIFNIYELTPTDGCPQSYCIGTEAKCPEGESSQNGFSPGCQTGDVPILNGTVEIYVSSEWVQPYREEVVFMCNVSEEEDDSHIFYDVTWTAENRRILKSEKSLVRTSLPAKLFESEWVPQTNLMGEKVTCTVNGKYAANGIIGPKIENDFFIGIEVLTPIISLNKDLPFPNTTVEPEYIEIRPTVPILCQTTLSGCKLVIAIQIPVYKDGISTEDEKPAMCNNQTIEDIAFQTQSCSVELNASEWHRIYMIPVYPSDSDMYSYTQTTRYRVELYIEENWEHMIWSSYDLPPVSVIVTTEATGDTPTEYCEVYNDPHFKTFDGRKYDNYIQGEFILYRHTAYPLQVHGYFEPCPNKNSVTCVCGGAVQSGADLFVFDRCRPDHPSRYRMYSCEDNSMTFDEINTDEYEIMLPTGARVVFQKSRIYIYPSKADRGLTEGMCGTFNGNCRDEFYLRSELNPMPDPPFNADCNQPSITSAQMKDFSNSWKVTNTMDSLYDGKPKNFVRGWTESNIHYCSCSQDQSRIQCGFTTGTTQQPCLSAKNDITSEQLASCLSERRKKREAEGEFNYHDDDVEDEVGDFPFNMEPVDPDMSWKNGWDEASATKHCTDAMIYNGAYNAVKDIDGVDLQGAIEECVLDVQLTGETVYTHGHLTGMIQLGAKFASQNLSMWYTVDGTGETRPPTEILDQVCPEDCNNNGTCIDGKCHCDDGISGIDCSIDKNAVPTLFNLPADGICDKSTRPCGMSPVYADVFVNSENLTCKFKHFTISSENTTEGESSVVKGHYSHSQKVFCDLPVVDVSDNVVLGYGYHISVSNDGSTFSSPKSLVVYDSTCVDCTARNICIQKLDTCFIQNQCIMKQASNIADGCQLCEPSSSMNSWTRDSSDHCNTNNGMSSGLIIGIAVICGAILAASIVAAVIIWKNTKMRVQPAVEVAEKVPMEKQ